MPTLAEVFAKYSGSDKGTNHSYPDVYEELFAPLSVTRVLEIGVRDGSSLRAWAEYWHHAEVYGIDNGSESGYWHSDDPRVRVDDVDCRKPHQLRDYSRWFDADRPNRLFDIVIDDGSHSPLVQMATFSQLFPLVRKGGLYVVEDVEDIGWAERMAREFGGRVIDLREVKQRHDDILAVFEGK